MLVIQSCPTLCPPQGLWPASLFCPCLVKLKVLNYTCCKSKAITIWIWNRLTTCVLKIDGCARIHWKEAFFTINTEPLWGGVKEQHLGARFPCLTWLSPFMCIPLVSSSFKAQNPRVAAASNICCQQLSTQEDRAVWTPGSVWTEHTGRSGRHVPCYSASVQFFL